MEYALHVVIGGYIGLINCLILPIFVSLLNILVSVCYYSARILCLKLLVSRRHSPLQNYPLSMVRRTYESDAAKIEDVDDLDDLVADKRVAWRATSDNARRRQRRYKKRLTNRLIRQDYFDDELD